MLNIKVTVDIPALDRWLDRTSGELTDKQEKELQGVSRKIRKALRTAKGITEDTLQGLEDAVSDE